MSTPFATRCDILSDVWMSYRHDDSLENFIVYNDLGLPLAFAIAEGTVDPTPEAEEMINETFDMLLEVFSFDEDTGFNSIDQLIEDGYVHSEEDNDDEDDENLELAVSDEYKEGYKLGFKAGASAEQERVQSIAEMNMKWAKQLNKGSEFMHWNNVSEILKPVTIDPNFDDGDF